MTRRKNQFVNLAARVKLAVVFDEIDWARPVLDSIMAKTCDKTTVPKIVKSFRLPGKIFQKKCENKSLRKKRFAVWFSISFAHLVYFLKFGIIAAFQKYMSKYIFKYVCRNIANFRGQNDAREIFRKVGRAVIRDVQRLKTQKKSNFVHSTSFEAAQGQDLLQIFDYFVIIIR